jgi:mycofactocin system glycosyltransferase
MTLPDGFTVQLGRRARLLDGGRSLVGGSPTRVMYLTERASGMIVERRVTVVDAATRTLANRLLEAGIADPVLASLAEQDPSQLTVVVPAYGRTAALERTLASISGAHPVIVVDDCSPDAAAMRHTVESHGARLLRLPKNGGPAVARNAGLAEVTTPFVAFVDSDIVLDPDAIPVLLRHFGDPQVAVAAPRVKGLRDERGLNWIGRYEEARSSLDLGVHPATVRPRSPVSWVSSAVLVARVDAIGDGFSADMRVGEDVDFVWRLVEQGWRVRFEPAATVWHEHRQTVDDWLTRKAFYGSSAHLLSERHPKDIAPAVLAPWSVGVIAALLAQRRWSIPVALGISAAAAWRIAGRLKRSGHPYRLAGSLTGQGVAASVSQAMALLVRHWWPLAAVASVFSRRIRRAVVVAGVVDAALEYRRTKPDLDPVRFGIARRLDDLAYGAGVWLSAIRGRSARSLLPDVRRTE